jgi:hypothetical protein
MLSDEEQFENNIMPKLQAKDKYAKDHGKTKYEFTVEDVREFQREWGGLGINGWDDKEIRDRLLPNIIKKGLIEEEFNGWYSLTEKGLSWKPMYNQGSVIGTKF